VHGYCLAVGAWLSNFCHGLLPLGTFSSKMEFLRKRNKVWRIGAEGEKKIAVSVKIG